MPRTKSMNPRHGHWWLYARCPINGRLGLQVTRSPVAPNCPARSLHIIMGTCAQCRCSGSISTQITGHKYLRREIYVRANIDFSTNLCSIVFLCHLDLGWTHFTVTDNKRGMNDLTLVHLRFLTLQYKNQDSVATVSMQMLIIAANKRRTLLFARWENHSFQFCPEKIWISVTVTH